MTEKQVRDFIGRSTWKFAKTMPEMPHFYTLRKDAERDEEFLGFAQFIRDFGYDASFGKARYRYADFDGWQYWTMGFVLDSTILINRAQTGREDVSLVRNPVPMRPKSWPQTWCPTAKRLIPRQPELELD